MVQRITAQLSEAEAAAVDAAVAEGRFPSRSAAVRAGLAAVLAEEQPPDDVETVEGELVVVESAPPVEWSRPARGQALELARRAALPLLGTGAAAVAALALRRRGAEALPARRFPASVNVVVVLRRG